MSVVASVFRSKSLGVRSSGLLIRASVLAFTLFCIILPALSIFLRISPDGIAQALSSGQLPAAIRNTLVSASLTASISVVIGFFGSMVMNRVDMRFKGVLSVLFLLPMLIPSISHAFGLVSLFGKNGFFVRLLRLNVSIYGMSGIVAGSVMYSFPIAFLMISSVLRQEDYTPHEAAYVMGIGPFRRFFALTWPHVRKTLLSVFLAVFTMAATDYGVPLMIGGKTITLSVLMYNKAVSLLDYSSGSVIGVLLIVPAITAFIADLLCPESAVRSFQTRSFPPDDDIRTKALSYAFCFILAVIVVVPIASFALMSFSADYPSNMSFTFHHVLKTIDRGGIRFLFNSVSYALFAAVFGTVLSFISAYVTSRGKGVTAKFLHLSILISMAVPGMFLGLAYVIFFNKSIIYGTFLIVGLVNIVHFMSSPYLMMYNTLGKVNPNLEDAGLVLGIGRFRIVIDVIVPKVRSTLLEIFAYYFINSMMTISAVSFLAPPAPKPLSLMINQFESQLLMESAAFVSILILVVNFCIKIVCDRLARGRTVESF